MIHHRRQQDEHRFRAENEDRRKANETRHKRAMEQLLEVHTSFAQRRHEQEQARLQREAMNERVVVSLKIYSFMQDRLGHRVTQAPPQRLRAETIRDASGFLHHPILAVDVTLRRSELDGISLGVAYWNHDTPGITELDQPSWPAQSPFLANDVEAVFDGFRSNVSAFTVTDVRTWNPSPAPYEPSMVENEKSQAKIGLYLRDLMTGLPSKTSPGLAGWASDPYKGKRYLENGCV
jgi:hypothetical protein